jgi:tight adherence protein B
LILQRKFGGDMVQMLGETSALLRERLELEREVRAITTQGRLSGIVIAALVPVSAGFLLAFNPRYIDVLFDNLLGQGLVILALALQLIGWAIISRLVRIRY